MSRRTTRLLAGAAAAALAASSLVLAPAAPADADPQPLGPGVTNAENPRVPEGAVWHEAYFPSSALSNNGDPVELHADIMRPEGLAPDVKTPVITSIGPYFNHADAFGHAEIAGPAGVFNDVWEQAGLAERGYTFVYVDLRGFGGATGCLDGLGPGEQADVVTAIEWLAEQEWSTGKVGTFGYSYDADTGLVAAAEQPEGLAAVVASEPTWDQYNYFYSNNLPRPTQLYTSYGYNEIADLKGVTWGERPDSEKYQANAAYDDYEVRPECFTENIDGAYENTTADSAYWAERNTAQQVTGSDVPIFVTQGFIEPNTLALDMDEYLANHKGPQRAWLGPWDHNPPWIDNWMGRDTWFAEVMSFYDQYLKGIEPTEAYPNFLIQDSFGKWRGQDTWPGDAEDVTVQLGSGTYLDDSVGIGPPEKPVYPFGYEGVGDSAARPMSAANARPGKPGPPPMQLNKETAAEQLSPRKPMRAADEEVMLVASEPVAEDLRLTGTPMVLLETSGERNVMVRLWELTPNGEATRINENAGVLNADGLTEFDLLHTDWTLTKGSQLVVTITSVSDDAYWWPEPSNELVTVRSASLGLSLQTTDADVAAAGEASQFLEMYRDQWTVDGIEPVEGTFTLALADEPSPTPPTPEPTPPSPQPTSTAPTPNPSGSPEPTGSPEPSSSATPRPTDPAPSTTGKPDPTTVPTSDHPTKPKPPMAETGGAELGALLAGVAMLTVGAVVLRRRRG